MMTPTKRQAPKSNTKSNRRRSRHLSISKQRTTRKSRRKSAAPPECIMNNWSRAVCSARWSHTDPQTR